MYIIVNPFTTFLALGPVLLIPLSFVLIAPFLIQPFFCNVIKGSLKMYRTVKQTGLSRCCEDDCHQQFSTFKTITSRGRTRVFMTRSTFLSSRCSDSTQRFQQYPKLRHKWIWLARKLVVEQEDVGRGHQIFL